MRGSTGYRQQGVDALAQPGAQDGVIEVCSGFFEAFYRVVLRGETEAEPLVLRENVPHPMRSFPPGLDFGEGCLIVRVLGIDESGQVVRIAHL